MATINQIKGCGTAIVTPFKQDESIDEAALRRFVEFQIANGVDFLIACGTTGESVTLSEEEQARVVQITIEAAAGRVPVLGGAGGYNTRENIEKTHRYEKLGADAILSVTPYYNKPTQEGLYQHFRAIHDATSLPIMLYNVPGRTSVNMEPATTARLASLPRIHSIKEASGNISQIGEVAALTAGLDFKLFAGDDSVVLPVAALGGIGVVSVASNIAPKLTSDLAHLCLAGNYVEARKLYNRLTPLFKTLFIESNPMPVKAALAMAGLIEEVYRLPMVPMTQGNRAKLAQVLSELGILGKAITQAGSQ
ncbi:MAG: 4-hydroxy-tetrahydrodipicolinate synthase [Acidobacteria bacterium]|nr:4-hydroxy-tetrahydrodipicolinate synthase [Acidobacteriota bacterium]MBI3423251.1 4-hydroxy-tetrahydrodipicolinate synthase [Acidobacteriota bacterium]